MNSEASVTSNKRNLLSKQLWNRLLWFIYYFSVVILFVMSRLKPDSRESENCHKENCEKISNCTWWEFVVWLIVSNENESIFMMIFKQRHNVGYNERLNASSKGPEFIREVSDVLLMDC